jgi:hypothetical protein
MSSSNWLRASRSEFPAILMEIEATDMIQQKSESIDAFAQKMPSNAGPLVSIGPLFQSHHFLGLK